MGNATWWSDLTKKTAEGESRFFGQKDQSRKGKFGAECFHPTCKGQGADWFNKVDCRYYCDSCARAINEMNQLQGVSATCVLHV